jgi:hypothetical protein
LTCIGVVAGSSLAFPVVQRCICKTRSSNKWPCAKVEARDAKIEAKKIAREQVQEDDGDLLFQSIYIPIFVRLAAAASVIKEGGDSAEALDAGDAAVTKAMEDVVDADACGWGETVRLP